MSTTKDPGLGNDDISKKRREKQRQDPNPPAGLRDCLLTRPLENFDSSWRHLIEKSVGHTLGAHRALLIIETSAPTLLSGYFVDKGIAHARLGRIVVAPVLDVEGRPIQANRLGVRGDLERLAAHIADEISLAVCEVRSQVVVVEQDDVFEGEAIDLDRTLRSHDLVFKYKIDRVTPLPHPANVETAFERHPDIVNGLRWDELRYAVMILRPLAWMPVTRNYPRVWDEDDSFHCAAWLLRMYELNVETRIVSLAAKTVARKTCVHPVREKLRSFEWDGVERVETWLTRYFGVADTTYARLAGQYWLRSAVARAFEPGCKVDTLLILEGPQGTRKSQAIKVLCEIVSSVPSVVRDTRLPIGEKDAFQQLDGVWVYELAELNEFDKTTAGKLKAFFSSFEDSYRRSYGETVKAVGRRVVFIGTINPEEGKGYFVDTTGNRRYWPVAVSKSDVEALRADREQLWAEAVVQYRKTRRWWPTPEETPLFVDEQAKRVASNIDDPWTEKLRDKLPTALLQDVVSALDHGNISRPYECLTTTRLMSFLEVQSHSQSENTGGRLRKIMRALGYVAPTKPTYSHNGMGRHWMLGGREEPLRREVIYQLWRLRQDDAAPNPQLYACKRLEDLIYEAKIDIEILKKVESAISAHVELQDLTSAVNALCRLIHLIHGT